MALKFYNLRIADIKRETSDAIVIQLDIPDDLKDIFKYKAGQYLNFRLVLDGKEERRSYSIATSPECDDHIGVAVKRASEGKVSGFLNDNLKPGDYLDVMPPLGDFAAGLEHSGNGDKRNKYILFGGGSGITPLISIIKSILCTEKSGKLILFYSNRNEDSVIFKDELQHLREKYRPRLEIVHVLSKPGENWNGEKGRINYEKCVQLLTKYAPDDISDSEYLLCGHPGMMVEVDRALEDIGLPKKQIHKESYVISSHEELDLGTIEPGIKNGDLHKARKIDLTLYGERKIIDVEPGDVVLVAAMKAGMDPPFSCQIGACSTCRAKLKSGRVHMDEREALTDEDIEEGYILTCQSHPLSDDVIIDYDDQ